MLDELRQKGLAQELDKERWARVHSMPADAIDDDKRSSTWSQADEDDEEDERRYVVLTCMSQTTKGSAP